jgi:hypothetical protein
MRDDDDAQLGRNRAAGMLPVVSLNVIASLVRSCALGRPVKPGDDTEYNLPHRGMPPRGKSLGQVMCGSMTPPLSLPGVTAAY